MNIIVELDFVESSMMQGDFGNAIRRLESSVRKERQRRSMAGLEGDTAEITVLESILDTIRGKHTLQELKSLLSKSTALSTMLDGKIFLDRFTYNFAYCTDRYFLSYPEYNQKRCDDL